jgi:hypothetical protein
MCSRTSGGPGVAPPYPRSADGVRGQHLGVADVVFVPYLPITSGARVGGWQLTPFNEVPDNDRLPEELRTPVTRLVDAYRVENTQRMGAIAYPIDGHIGSDIERAAIPSLRLALVAGVIADDPRMALSEEQQEAKLVIRY